MYNEIHQLTGISNKAIVNWNREVHAGCVPYITNGDWNHISTSYVNYVPSIHAWLAFYNEPPLLWTIKEVSILDLYITERDFDSSQALKIADLKLIINFI